MSLNSLTDAEALNITQSPDAYEDDPVFSPDGSYIAYGDESDGYEVVYVKALTVKGCIGGKMAKAFELMSTGEIDTTPLISHVFPLDEINEAFEIATKPDESIKVLVKT